VIGLKPLRGRLTVPAKRNRGLAFLLLACLAWGATAEFTHHHGVQIQTAASRNANTDQTTARFQARNDNGRSSTSRSQTECLICQLHQDLSATELNQPAGIDAAETRISHSLANISVHPSEFPDAQRGRAPPENL
jgi:hypothetical protein